MPPLVERNDPAMSNSNGLRAMPTVSSFEQDVKKDSNSARRTLNAGELQAEKQALVSFQQGSGGDLHGSAKSSAAVGSSRDGTWNEGSQFDVMA